MGCRLRTVIIKLRRVMLAVALVTLFPASAPALSESPVLRANSFGGTPAVGALFGTTSRGRVAAHFCSAAVVNSPHGDLVVTAAHCTGGGDHLVFIPGYLHGHAPYGVWRVRRIVTSKRWAKHSDQDDDYAFLVVGSSRDGRSVQGRTGGEGIVFDEPSGKVVQAIGYPNAKSAPVTCRNRIHAFSKNQLSFACAGYYSGTSGGPLLADVNRHTGLGLIAGVIGGYQQGGKTNAISYAARFVPATMGLYRKAVAESR